MDPKIHRRAHVSSLVIGPKTCKTYTFICPACWLKSSMLAGILVPHFRDFIVLARENYSEVTQMRILLVSLQTNSSSCAVPNQNE